jgi:hypothetical protein
MITEIHLKVWIFNILNAIFQRSNVINEKSVFNVAEILHACNKVNKSY